MNEIIQEVIPKEENRDAVAIWSDARPDPCHCWIRAGFHCYTFKTLPYAVQHAAAKDCQFMCEAILREPRPPQRAVNPVQWGWGKGRPGVS